MILLTLIVSVVLGFIFFIYIQNKPVSYLLTVLSLIVAVGSTWFIIKNDTDHYGMEKQVKTTYQPIYSVSPSKQMKLLLYQPIGTANKKQVYIYKTSENAKKTSHTAAEHTTNKVVTSKESPRIETKTTRWEYTSNTSKLWFGIADEGNKLVKRENKILINKDWVVLTVKQSKALQKKMKDKAYQAQLKTQGKAFVAKQVMAAMKKNPKMSKAQQAQLVKQATAQFQAQAIQKLINSIKK